MTAVRKELRRRRKPLWFATAFVALAAVLVFAFGASANLPGSTFEGNDGNFAVNTPGNTDWVNVHGGVTTGADLPTGQTDNSFGQGTKESDVNVTVVSGQIPNSKADLGNFYVANETLANNHVLMYLGWTRINTSGTTNFDFEINQVAQPDLTTPGPKTLVRTAGDLIINYDFQGGAQNPTLAFRTWQANGTWSAATPIGGTSGEAEVNRVDLANPLAVSPSPATAPAFTFGEAALDLTALNIVPPGSCAPFSSAYVKSRSSDAFTSAVKDFIAPVQLNLNRCGTVTIIKHTNPGGLDQNFDFTSTLAGGEITCTADTSPASFTLNDAGTDTETCTKVPIGSYIATEGADPAGFDFNDVTCEVTGSGTGVQDGTIEKQVNIGINAGGDTVTCTYVNDQVLGAIKISKTSSKTDNALAGATFSITSGGNPIAGSPFTTDANGEICVDGLTFGPYVVTETGAPPGFVIDDTAGHTVTVDNNAACDDASYVGESIAFTDTPTADIQVRFRDGGSGETSLSQALSCTNATGTSSTADTTGWDDTLTVSGIKVDSNTVTVTCTIVIDP
jgi:Prealbumin-like fold domain